jgi:hypothetical protein
VPLLVPGVLAVLSVPLSVLASPSLPNGVFMYPQKFGTVTSAMYLGGGVAGGPSPFPLGWYWTAALAVTVAGSLAWLRRCDQLPGTRTLRTFGLTGIALTVITAALPLLGWRTPVNGVSHGLWTWLDALWLQGTFALGSVTVLLAVLSWKLRSRALTVITSLCIAAVGLAGWLEVRRAVLFDPYGDHPAALLPGTVLTVTGLAAAAAALARARRQRANISLELRSG